MDNNATTQVHPCVIKYMTRILRDIYANPSSSHQLGRIGKKYIQNARKTIAKLIQVPSKSIIFTSSATESNNLALRGYFMNNRKRGKHIIISPIEHASVLKTCEDLVRKFGAKLSFIPVDEYGIVDTNALKKLIRKDTIICSVMACNNEIGTIQPIAKIGEICHKKGIFFHCDATQYIGHYRIHPQKYHIDAMSFSAHKMHGPRGIGVLYIKNKSMICPCTTGGGHEMGMRAGTEATYLMCSQAYCLKFNLKRLENTKKKVKKMKNGMCKKLKKLIPNIIFNGHPIKSKYNTISICLPNIDSRKLLPALDKRGICINVGSACSMGKRSKVLEAIGLPEELEKGAFRISLSEYNTPAECNRVCQVLAKLYYLKLNK